MLVEVEKLAVLASPLNGSDTLPYPEASPGSAPSLRRKGHCYRASGRGVSIAQALPHLK